MRLCHSRRSRGEICRHRIKFLFGPARWLRSFAKPPEGWGLAYLDFSAEEIAIGAALSGDEVLARHNAEGDVYLNFAAVAGLSPGPHVRPLCKVLFLGIGYGMGPATRAQKLGVPLWRARDLIEIHRRTYPQFTRWREETADGALLERRIVRLNREGIPRRHGLRSISAEEAVATPRAYSQDLRERVVAFVDCGSRRAAAAHFDVSPSFAQLDDGVAGARQCRARGLADAGTPSSIRIAFFCGGWRRRTRLRCPNWQAA